MESPLEKQKQFGKYLLLEPVGEGGAGKVWKARDQFGNTVAIKTLIAGKDASGEQLERFIHEAEMMSKLPHRGICRIHEVGTEASIHYIAMEFIKGVPLSKILLYDSGGPAPEAGLDLIPVIEDLINSPDKISNPSTAAQYNRIEETQALQIGVKLCAAIQFTHEHGILHRDIKPHNIMLGLDGDPVIMDFGIAKTLQEVRGLRGHPPDRLFGTIEYMAPEQAALKDGIDERADVYSLGAVLYQILTGRKHFTSSGNLVRDIKKLQSHEPVTPHFYNKQLAWELNAILLKALSRSPLGRYAAARELEEDLERYQKGETITAQRPGILRRLKKQAIKQKTAVFLLAVLLSAMILFAGYLLIEGEKESGNWIPIFTVNFTAPNPQLNRLEFKDGRNHKQVGKFPLSPQGLQFRPGHWLWIRELSEARTRSNLKLDLTVVFRNRPDELVIAFNSQSIPVSGPAALPPGYSVAHAANGGTSDILRKTEQNQKVSLVNSAASETFSNTSVKLTIEKRRDRISYFVNGNKKIHSRDFLPLLGPEFHQIGFTTHAPSLYIQSIKIFRLSLPEKASPLIAAEALEETGHAEEALEELLIISEDYPDTEVAQNALLKAFRLTLQHSSLASHTRRIKETFMAQYPNSPELGNLLAIETIDQWRKGHAAAGVEMLNTIHSIDPEIQLVDQLDLNRLDRTELQSFLDFLRKLPHIPSLNLIPRYSLETQDLRGLKPAALYVSDFGLREFSLDEPPALRSLWARNNEIESLTFLAGAPLVYFDGRFNRISSLLPLKNIPLKILDLSHNKISELNGLENSPLEFLNLSHNAIASLEKLRGLPLTVLNLSHNRISVLDPLGSSNLTELYADYNNISQLRRIPYRYLRVLSLNHNPLERVDVLRSSRVKVLSLAHTKIGSLAPLKGMELESLNLAGTVLENYSELNVLSVKSLDLSYSGLKVMDTMYSRELVSLNLEGNHLRSLGSIAQLRLAKLHASGNRITSLRPLKSMKLTFLDVERNPIKSLSHLFSHAPDTFLFESPSLPASEIQKALKQWSGDPKMNYNSDYARIALHIRNNNVRRLKRMAIAYDGHFYLHVPLRVTWQNARNICRALNGHLATLSSFEENNVILKALRDNYPVWIGLTRNKSGWHWETEEALTYFNTDYSGGYRHYHTLMYSGFAHNGRWEPFPETRNAGFIIEWDS